MSIDRKPLKIAGIGEILWDRFDTGKRVGGAPLNFCYHCSQMGATGYAISAVGEDALGREIEAEFLAKGISRKYLARLSPFPTGTVDITLNEKGKPSYLIHESVAWDFIPSNNETLKFAKDLDAICFGTLAQRNAVSRDTIHEVLQAMRPDAIKILDINIRQAFYSEAIIQSSLQQCNVLKLSDEELPLLENIFDLSGSIEQQLRTLMERFELRLIAYTRGPNGSLLISPNQIDDCEGVPREVCNTVGAGDSFTATLCIGLLRGRELKAINLHANHVATFVCTQDTATPRLPDELKGGMVYED